MDYANGHYASWLQAATLLVVWNRPMCSQWPYVSGNVRIDAAPRLKCIRVGRLQCTDTECYRLCPYTQ